MPEECCWFATRSRCGVSRISNNVLNCAAFLDCSHHTRDKEWFYRSSAISHPFEMIRQRDNYETFASERGDASYVIIGKSSNGSRNGSNGPEDEHSSDNETREQTTLKMDDDGSPKRSSVSSEKKDGKI